MGYDGKQRNVCDLPNKNSEAKQFCFRPRFSSQLLVIFTRTTALQVRPTALYSNRKTLGRDSPFLDQIVLCKRTNHHSHQTRFQRITLP
jgi:hypothetical protein